MDLRNTRTTILNQGDPEQKRAEILAYFHATFDIDEKLYDTLRHDDTFYLRADRLRHPLIFYFGHTATFYINKLTVGRVIEKRINPRFESMFAVGVDEMSWDDLNEAHYDWPTRGQVKEYRDKVRELLGPGEFIEIYVNASLETCEKRDPKGLYKKARAGELKGFTGIDDPYEAPEKPELVLDSNSKSIDDLAREVITYLEKNGYFKI